MTKSQVDIAEPGSLKLAEYIRLYCYQIRVSPTALFEKCNIQRSEWTRLNKGSSLSIGVLRKLSEGLSIPLGKLLLISGFLTTLEVANMNAPAVIEEVEMVMQADDPRQIWRLTDAESEIMRYYRHLKHDEAKATIRQTLRGFVRLTSHISMDMPPENIDGQEDII